MYKNIVLNISNIGNQEDYYGKLIYVNGVLLSLAIIFCLAKDFYLSIFSHIFILLWISLTANNIFSLHRKYRTDFSWNLSIHSNLKRFLILINASFLHSGIFLVFTFAQFLLIFNAKLYIAIITAILHYFYAVAIGIFIGTIVKNRLLSPAITIIFYLFFFFFRGSSWPTIERYRIFSPSVQLLNMSRPLVTNIVSLTAITIFIFIFSYYIIKTKSKKPIIKYILLIFSMVFILTAPLCEAYINRRTFNQNYQIIELNEIAISYRGVDEDIATQYANMLMDVNTTLEKEYPVYHPIKKMTIQKYFIAPYLKTRMIPFSLEDGSLHINICSDAMTNFNNPELLYNMFTRMLYTSKGKNIKTAELIQNIALTNRYGNDFIEYTTTIYNKVR